MSVCSSVRLSFRLSFRMEKLGSYWTDCHYIRYVRIFRKSFQQIQVSLKYDKISGYYTSDLCTFMIIVLWILPRVRNVSDKFVQKIRTHIRQATDDNMIRRMRFACWMTKATDTHSECVILLAFARQQWLRESVSMWRCMYIACLAYYCLYNRAFYHYVCDLG